MSTLSNLCNRELFIPNIPTIIPATIQMFQGKKSKLGQPRGKSIYVHIILQQTLFGAFMHLWNFLSFITNNSFLTLSIYRVVYLSVEFMYL